MRSTAVKARGTQRATDFVNADDLLVLVESNDVEHLLVVLLAVLELAVRSHLTDRAKWGSAGDSQLTATTGDMKERWGGTPG